MRRNIVRPDRHRCGKIMQVGERAVGPEQQLNEAARRWEISALMPASRTPGTPDIELDGVAARHGAGLEQARQFRRVIDMQMSQQNDVDLFQGKLGFTEPGECA
jgi:hypothetical protein